MAAPLMLDNVWLQRQRFEEAEAHYYAVMAGTASPSAGSSQGGGGSLRSEISEARQQIQNALKQPGGSSGASASPQLQRRLDTVEKENKELKKVTNDLRALIVRLEARVVALEKGGKGDAPSAAKGASASKPAADDDFDLFGDTDEESEEEESEERKKSLEAYKAKKAQKPGVIAKSSIVLDCKPWDDETDMKEMERLVRTIQMDGLNWGASKLLDLAYGIKKLQIMCTIEDEKVSVEDMREQIEEFEDYVQSCDIAAFNKI